MSNIDTDPDFDSSVAPIDLGQARRREAAYQTVNSVDLDPEKAARAAQLGQISGTDPSLILPNLENFETQQKVAVNAAIVQRNRFLQEYIAAHPIHAQISNDDYGNLDALSQSLTSYFPGKYRLAGEIGSGIIGGIIEGYKEGAVKGGGIGDWAFLSTSAKDAPLTAAIAGVGWAPLEIALRFGSGV